MNKFDSSDYKVDIGPLKNSVMHRASNGGLVLTFDYDDDYGTHSFSARFLGSTSGVGGGEKDLFRRGAYFQAPGPSGFECPTLCLGREYDLGVWLSVRKIFKDEFVCHRLKSETPYLSEGANRLNVLTIADNGFYDGVEGDAA